MFLLFVLLHSPRVASQSCGTWRELVYRPKEEGIGNESSFISILDTKISELAGKNIKVENYIEVLLLKFLFAVMKLSTL